MKFTGIIASILLSSSCASAVAVSPKGGNADISLGKRQFLDGETATEIVEEVLTDARNDSIAKIRNALVPALDPRCPEPVARRCQDCVTGAQITAISAITGCGIATAAAVTAASEFTIGVGFLGLAGFTVCEGGVMGNYETALNVCKGYT
ncbi:hypothetical protein DDE82_000091 [Stemphylium lycopersici]|uniref:Uncharacterized protein n=1 Tax=Stemphylium lycopersici TaxID=183478 RepID=A0A364N8G7_STELY|nr:hypothetical protein DDE82_000091 [Stemphylium lycopersici]RAR13618.1 hypothetical protein DDE83_003076 [Stemphylium lycopersici]